MSFALFSQADEKSKGVFFEIDYTTNMLWLVSDYEGKDCMKLVFASIDADSALPIVCRSYVEDDFLIYLIDIPLIQLEGRGEILQLCSKENGFRKIFEYEFKNGRFIVKSQIKDLPQDFNFSDIKANMNKTTPAKVITEKQKPNKIVDLLIVSGLVVFLGTVWTFLLFNT